MSSKANARKIAKTGDVERLKTYLSHLEISEPSDYYQATVEALNGACEYSQLEIIRYILTDEHMDSLHTNYMSKNDYEAFRHACKTDDVEIVRYLTTSPELKEHADIYYRKGTALLTALNYKCHNVVNYFLYDMRMKISLNDQYLNPGNKYADFINKRDIFFKLQDELKEKDIKTILRKI